jgi:CO/xanthine dehydrogenase Mo-binding subunit
VQLDLTYVTPVETHNPMEMQAAIAPWTKDKLRDTYGARGIAVYHATGVRVRESPIRIENLLSTQTQAHENKR